MRVVQAIKLDLADRSAQASLVILMTADRWLKNRSAANLQQRNFAVRHEVASLSWPLAHDKTRQKARDGTTKAWRYGARHAQKLPDYNAQN